jgi:hypothetical protein
MVSPEFIANRNAMMRRSLFAALTLCAATRPLFLSIISDYLIDASRQLCAESKKRKARSTSLGKSYFRGSSVGEAYKQADNNDLDFACNSADRAKRPSEASFKCSEIAWSSANLVNIWSTLSPGSTM